MTRCYRHKKKDKEWAKSHGGYLQGANQVRPSMLGPDSGNGLFASVSYQPNDYITKYEGPIRYYKHPSELTKQERNYALQWEKNKAAIIGVHMGQISSLGCGLGSLANDSHLGKGSSSNKRQNNARFSAPDHENKCCWLLADAYIQAESEIYVSYGPGYRLG